MEVDFLTETIYPKKNVGNIRWRPLWCLQSVHLIYPSEPESMPLPLQYKVIWTAVYLKYDLWNGSPFKWHRQGKYPWDSVRIIYLFIYFNRHRRDTWIKFYQTSSNSRFVLVNMPFYVWKKLFSLCTFWSGLCRPAMCYVYK